MALEFSETAYTDLNAFLYAETKHPVSLKNGMVIGGGTLYPEVHLSLTSRSVAQNTMAEVIWQYRKIITGICARARDLDCHGFVSEIELSPSITLHPAWGEQVCRAVVEITKEYAEKYGVISAVRITPTDIREGTELEHMWRGRQWDNILETFERCAYAGADLLAIKSLGGRETYDDAVPCCDIRKSLFALGVLGCEDMRKLWSSISDIAGRTGAIASGDTARGFDHTAMLLADREYIPKVFAAAVRVAMAVRSLVAIEQGARGPHKCCGYEGAYLKAISGTPIAMAGKTSDCAQLGSVGNVAGCLADVWSNEPIQNSNLFGGMAPTVAFEQLVYDCRLMNEASRRGESAGLMMRDLLADSVRSRDPRSYVLRPDIVLEISKEIVKETGHYKRTKRAAGLALLHMKAAYAEGRLMLDAKELEWLDRLADDVDDLP